MKINVRGNVSQFVRDMGALTAGPGSIYNRIGSNLRNVLLNEFEVLVRETPQWTGTTAASWEIGFSSDISGDVEEQPAQTRETALQKGSEAACSIAIAKSKSLSPDFTRYAKQDIILSNNAPGYDTAEEGPVRTVNTPPGALKRFEMRIATMDIEVDFYKP